MPRVEFARQRLDGVVGLAQLRISGHALQVVDQPHGIVQPQGQRVQGFQSVLEGSRLTAAPQGVQPQASIVQQSPDRGLDVFGADAVEGNAELNFKQGVGLTGFWHGFTQYKLLEFARGT